MYFFIVEIMLKDNFSKNNSDRLCKIKQRPVLYSKHKLRFYRFSKNMYLNFI